jgi:hypothetical protein
MTPPRKRPVSCLVFGILNIVFGSLSVIGNLCCVAGGFGLFFMFQTLERTIANDRNVPAAQKKTIQDLFGGLLDIGRDLAPFFMVVMAVGCILGILWLMSGIGLVRVKSWGRWLCVSWGIGFTVFVIAVQFWQLAYIYPAMLEYLPKLEKVMEEIEEEQRRQGQTPPPRQHFDQYAGSGNAIADNIMGLAVAGLEVAYALLCVVWMALPQTGHAIAAYNRKSDDEPGARPGDQYDDEYERRRRRELEPPEGQDPDRLGPA